MSGMTRRDLQTLAVAKLDDAKALIRGKRYVSAYYLAGYSVELGLKACISRRFLADVIPEKKLVNEIYTHNIEHLVRVARLENDLKARKIDSPLFEAHWEEVCQWTVESRYNPTGEVMANSMVRAITDRTDGVLEWVKLNW